MLRPIHPLAVERHRQPDLVIRAIEGTVFRQHADDRIRLVVELDRPSDQRRIGSKARHPNPVTEHDDMVPSRLILAGGERPADRRLSAQHVEVGG